MENADYFNKIKNNYESLNTFTIKDNIFIFHDIETNYTYRISLQNIDLSKINPNIFSLKPRDIYRIIYMIDLLQKDIITEEEVRFVKEYVAKYLKLEKERINGEPVDEILISNMSIPILLVDDPRPEIQSNIKNEEAKNIIINEFNDYYEKSNVGGEALVLRTKFYKEEHNNESFDPTTKAGFTSFILVLITIIMTILYIAIFFNK